MSVPTNSAILLILNAYVNGQDWRPVLGKIDKPVLYLASTVSNDQIDLIREKVPSARVELFRNSGHALFVDEPDRFNLLVAQFVAARNRP